MLGKLRTTPIVETRKRLLEIVSNYNYLQYVPLDTAVGHNDMNSEQFLHVGSPELYLQDVKRFFGNKNNFKDDVVIHDTYSLDFVMYDYVLVNS